MLVDKSEGVHRDVKRPRHITVFIPHLGGGGAERATLEIARGFVHRGLSVDLLVTRCGQYRGLVPEKARLVNFDSWKAVTCFPRFLRHLQRQRPDALLSTLIHTSILALIVKKFFIKDLPTIVRYESTFTMEFANGGFKQRIELTALKYLFPSADAIIAVSAGAAADLKRAIPGAARRVQVVPNPVVTATLAKQAKEPVEHPFFRDPGIPVILSAGRFVPLKDYPTLLRAFADVAISRPARLVILGEGPERGELVTLARRLKIAEKVDFPGFTSNPFAYMAKARVFALSSTYEGLGMVLIEAMACGTPVVSTDCRYGPREILEGGKWGRLVPVGDWRGLARAIREALDKPITPELLSTRANCYTAAASTDGHLRVLHSVTRSREQSDNT